MRRIGLAAALCALALAAAPARAAPAPDPAAGTAVDELTVTASKRRQDQLVRSFIEEQTTPSPSGQITRWLDRVCPGTFGLPEVMGAIATRRMREIVEKSGARLAEEGCRPNLSFVLTTDPQGFVDRVRKDAAGALGYHYLHDRQKISRFKAPAKAWYATETEDMNGVRDVDSADEPPGFSGRWRPYPGVRLTDRTISGLVSALVVIDAKAIYGMDITTLADYAAMAGLSQTTVFDGCKGLPSIANLLSPRCPADRKPTTITDADIAYLKGVYSMQPNLFADGQRSHIAFWMKKAMEEGK